MFCRAYKEAGRPPPGKGEWGKLSADEKMKYEQMAKESAGNRALRLPEAMHKVSTAVPQASPVDGSLAELYPHVDGSLSELYPHLGAQWDADQNGDLSPQAVKADSKKTVHWRCAHGHDHAWTSPICQRVRHPACPFCDNVRPRRPDTFKKSPLNRRGRGRGGHGRFASRISHLGCLRAVLLWVVFWMQE
jgi:hypothetical protein